MKTALIKTDFWKDEVISELNRESRFLYFHILTSPDRDTLPVLKKNMQMIRAYTLMTTEEINEAFQELQEKKLITIVLGYIIITENSYVKPSKGGDTWKFIKREIQMLPNEIIELLPEDIQEYIAHVQRMCDTLRNSNIKSNSKYNVNNNNTSEQGKDQAQETKPPEKPEIAVSEDINEPKAKKKAKKAKSESKDTSNIAPEATESPIQPETVDSGTMTLNNQIGAVIKAFEAVDPINKRYYANTTQRKAVASLIEEHGFESIMQIVEMLPYTNNIDVNSEKLHYIPTAYTPNELQRKIVRWIAQVKKAQLSNNKSKIIM